MRGRINRRFENSINDFGKKVVALSKGNLQKGKKGGGNLEKSIRYGIDAPNMVYSVNFYMEGYGAFVDAGVEGAGGEIKSGKHKGTYSGIQEYKNYKSEWVRSPFRYGSGRSSGSIYKGIGSFIKKKGLQPRVKKGKKGGGQYKSTLGLKIAIVKVLWTKGIKGISFFQNALRVSIKNFENDILTAMKFDLLEEIRTSINN